jgi:predicted transcriptional regulator
MKKTTVRLDDQIHDLLVRIAEKRQVSLNHLINYALVRFVSFEEAFETLEARARRARPGAMRTVLAHTAAHGLPPLEPADRLPPDFDRTSLEKRIAQEATLHTRRMES